jgi:NDP-sugar pyrophosphorylase family protein
VDPLAVKAVVLCAGYGTRLGELTKSTPKPLLPIGDEPLLAHTLRYLRGHGFSDVAVNLHFRPEQIPSAVGDGSRYGVRIHYSYEEKLLGTAGALRHLRSWLGDEELVLVLYGDLLVDHPLGPLVEQHRRMAADATLVLHERPGSNSLVAMDESRRIHGFVERPTEEERARHPYPWTNSGIAVVRCTLLDGLADGEAADLPRDVYAPRVREKRLFGQPVEGYRCAIDSAARYEAACHAYASGQYHGCR